MTQYSLRSSSFQPGMVGKVYNIGLSDGTHSYGYCFYNDGVQSTAMSEKSDIAAKDALVNYGSPNLVDRDLVFYPRVTQGDYSGGGLQTVSLDFTKYFDSDLEIRTPGYLGLRPAWQSVAQTITSPGTPQIVAWNQSVYYCYGTGSYFRIDGTSFSPPLTCIFLDTDGNSLFIGDGGNLIYGTLTNTSWYAVATGLGSHTQMWLINQGTNGRFLYYTRVSPGEDLGGADTLYKIDMAGTLPATTGVLVPTNITRFAIIDIVGYQAGIAILTNDPGNTSFTVWYHDGQNMTPIVKVNQYVGKGVTLCLGDLYVTAESAGRFEGPVLMRIGPGSFDIVVRAASPVTTLNSSDVGAPTSSGQYVYLPLKAPQINQVSSADYIGVYDAVTNAFSHLGNSSPSDSLVVGSPRTISFNGRAAATTWATGNSITSIFQTNSSNMPALVSPVPIYATSGWVVSSKYDFSTPGVGKRFRRIEATHNPLNPGESVVIKAFVDQDPLKFTPSLAPVPAGAQVTNSTAGSTSTVLTVGADTVGRTLYYALQLRAGTNQQTSPSITYVAIEVGGTWAWDFDLDCSSKRRNVQQQSDGQFGGMLGGKDLYFLLRNSYENGNNLTLYLAENLSYQVAIESLQTTSLSYSDKPTVNADEEWRCKVVLRQMA